MTIKKTISKLLLVLLLLSSAGLYSQSGQRQRFFCKYCGMEYASVRDLTANWCQNNPQGKSGYHHELYEGSVKSQYTCKYCGLVYRDLLNLTRNICQRHPGGKGRCHEPAL